jgi:hypothetical protein
MKKVSASQTNTPKSYCFSTPLFKKARNNSYRTHGVYREFLSKVEKHTHKIVTILNNFVPR